MKFKVVSTGQRVGNLNEDPKIRIFPETNRFKLNQKAVAVIGAAAGIGVTILADVESKLLAIHKAVPKLDNKGNVLMKPVKMSEERKEELIAEGKEVPMEIDYNQACKLGKHYEFSSGNSILQIGVTEKLVCSLSEVVKGSDIGIADVENVAIFSYGTAEVETEEEEEEEEETEEEN